MDVQVDEENSEGDSAAGQVDPPTPTPCSEIGKNATEDGAKCTSDSPDAFTETKEERALSITVSRRQIPTSGTHLMLKRSEMTMFTIMMSPPPATPCIALPTMSISMSTARAHIRLLIIKTATAASRIGFLPHLDTH